MPWSNTGALSEVSTLRLRRPGANRFELPLNRLVGHRPCLSFHQGCSDVGFVSVAQAIGDQVGHQQSDRKGRPEYQGRRSQL